VSLANTHTGMNPTDTQTEDALTALRWQNEMGVDIALGEAPADRFAEAKVAAPSLSAPGYRNPSASGPVKPPAGSAAPATAPPPAALQPDQSAIKTAVEIAASAGTLPELEKALENFDGCPLKQRATRLVFGDGNPQADVMVIGEAPGRDEDIEGRPFVGRSGQLLDKIFAAIGLDRTKIYIANTVPWRPPGNRDPSAAELAVCRPFLERQIELIAPKIIVTLGAAATREVIGGTAGIMRMRGQWRDITMGKHSCVALATLHPAYLLRQPAQKGLVWADMLALGRRLAQ
jgi:uracil-DNA glycosylase